jgi:hypothetical protein
MYRREAHSQENVPTAETVHCGELHGVIVHPLLCIKLGRDFTYKFSLIKSYTSNFKVCL